MSEKITLTFNKLQVEALKHLTEKQRLLCHTNPMPKPSWQSKDQIKFYNDILNILYLYGEDQVNKNDRL